jgi:hypothetical protein
MPSNSPYGFYIALEEITGKKTSVPELFGEITKIRRSDLFVCIAGMAELIKRDALSPKVQLAFLKAVLPDDLWKKIEAAVRPRMSEPWTIFHRSQLWLLMQMALLVGREDGPTLSEDELKRQFTQCCLMANDVLKQIEIAPFPEPTGKDDLPIFICGGSTRPNQTDRRGIRRQIRPVAA